MEEVKAFVQDDMKHLREREEYGRNDTEGYKQLDELITLMTIFLMNTESSVLNYKFIRIELEEPFDEDRMEPVEAGDNNLEVSRQRPVVRIAMTRPLMECDEMGKPQSCIVKAKVILKLPDG